MVKEIESKEEFENEVLKNEKRVLVDFFATWCGPCQMQGPILDSLKEENPEIEIFKVDIDKNRDLAAENNILSVPTFILFENGKDIKTFSGLHSKDDLKEIYIND